MVKAIKKFVHLLELGGKIKNNDFHRLGEELISLELSKSPSRTDIINFLLNTFEKKTSYLEIGVRFPEENFNMVSAFQKYSVDPGYENPENPVQFKMTSDNFFSNIRNGKILNTEIKFDVIFIDGLHLADQVERDLTNSLEFLDNNGFILIHDCNPPSYFHASEIHDYKLSPAKGYWNGTTWKAFFKYRQKKEVFSCCNDSDWGVGVISKNIKIGRPTEIRNPFFEFEVLNKNRKESLNLISFEDFKNRLRNLSSELEP